MGSLEGSRFLKSFTLNCLINFLEVNRTGILINASGERVYDFVSSVSRP